MALTTQYKHKVMFTLMEVMSCTPTTAEALHEHCAKTINGVTVAEVTEVLESMIRIEAVDVDPNGQYFDCTAYATGDISRGVQPVE
jgi:hypothetical protein